MRKDKVYSIAYELSDKLSKLFVANILWIILNSPLLIVAIQLRVANQPSSYYVLLPLLSLGLPIFFFPTTQALFGVVRDIVLQNQTSTIKTFGLYLFNNYKESLKMGVLSTGAVTGIGIGLYYSWFSSLILFTILLTLLFFTMVWMLQLFCFQVHFDMPIMWKLKRTRQLIFSRLVYSIGSFMFILLLVYASFEMSIAVFVFVTPATCAYLTFLLFNFQYNKILATKKIN